MSRIEASVFILTYNSQQDIVKTLASVQRFADIVVVDSGSTDNTLALLKEHPVRVFHHDWLGFAKQKAYAMSQCHYDWVFNLDSDEVADHALVSFIAKVIKEQAYTAVKVRIREHFLGHETHAWTKHCAKIRVFNKHQAGYEDVAVHEGVLVQGKVIQAPGFIQHYGEKRIGIKMAKINEYSELKPQQKGVHYRLWLGLGLIFIFPLAFFKSYILRRQCCNGLRGFMAAMMNAFYAFLKQAKCYERDGVKTDG